MRFTDLSTFELLLSDMPFDMVTEKYLREILKANNIEHKHNILNSFKLDDEDIDSLLHHNGWFGETHCAIYTMIVIKPRSIGATTLSFGSSGTHCQVTLVRGLNMDQLVSVCKKTIKMNAFL